MFRHALIREAVHDGLLPGERGQVHRRFAEAIGADPALVLPGRGAGEQAWHWYAARDVIRALVSAWQAAGQAGRALAYAEELAMVSRVLELWEQVPDAAQRIRVDHAAVLEAAARAAELAGEDDRGLALGQAALRDIDAAAEPVRAALLLLTCGHLKDRLGRADYADDLREALRLVPADPPSSARARVLEALAHFTLHEHRGGGWDDPALRAIAEEAVVTARRAGDAATEAAALVTQAYAEPTGSVERIRALLAQARAVASRAGAYEPLLEAASIEAETLEDAGLHEQAAEAAREGLTAARQHGLARTYGAVQAGNLAEPLLALGRWDEAAEIIEDALQLFPPRVNRTYLWRLAGELALARGDLAAAAESVASARFVLDDTRHHDQHHLPLVRLDAELRLAQGRPDEALEAVDDALDRFDLRRIPRYAWPLLVAGARTCAAAAAARDTALMERGRLFARKGAVHKTVGRSRRYV